MAGSGLRKKKKKSVPDSVIQGYGLSLNCCFQYFKAKAGGKKKKMES